jgi:hypothetical protein
MKHPVYGLLKQLPQNLPSDQGFQPTRYIYEIKELAVKNVNHRLFHKYFPQYLGLLGYTRPS